MKKSLIPPVLKNLRIKYKLFLSYSILSIIFISGVGYISYLSSTDALKKQSYDIIYQYQQNTIAEIQKNINRYEFLANTIYENLSIQRMISSRYMDPYTEYDTVRNVINPLFRAACDASGAGINIQMIRYGNSKSEIISTNIEGLLSNVRISEYYLDNEQKQFQVVNYDRVMELPWIQAVKGRLDGDIWRQVGYDKRYNYVSLLHEIADNSARIAIFSEKIGLLRLTVKFDSIYIEDMSRADKGFNLIFNEFGELLSAEPEKNDFWLNNEKLLYDLLLSSDGEMLLHEDRLLIKSQSFGSGWHIISVFPADYITDNINRIQNITVACLILSSVMLLLLTLFLSTSFSKRIIDIAKQIQRFKPGLFNMEIAGGGQDEIEFLKKSCNDMMEQISVLIRDNYQSSIDKKDALLNALQAQINPHFLSNSLSAVSRLAELGDTDAIIRMVHALSRFYRMTLNKGHETITIAGELEQIKAYLEIFSIRLGETFAVTYDVDPRALPCHTIKVILQPFVENIFEHAIKLDDSVINIYIAVQTKDDHIQITIQDDGVGIPDEKLGNLFIKGKSESYGIINVNERIKIQFGEDYGVNIDSVYGDGTTVTIIIPKIK